MVRQPETGYAKGPEGNIAYQVVGDGPMDLVVVPGWFSHVDMLWGDPGWATFVGEFASFARVILYDKRGTGLSDPVDGVPTLESLKTLSRNHRERGRPGDGIRRSGRDPLGAGAANSPRASSLAAQDRRPRRPTSRGVGGGER
jgi:pimeloyl-ACP methyl ester carboxylesterase